MGGCCTIIVAILLASSFIILLAKDLQDPEWKNYQNMNYPNQSIEVKSKLDTNENTIAVWLDGTDVNEYYRASYYATDKSGKILEYVKTVYCRDLFS